MATLSAEVDATIRLQLQQEIDNENHMDFKPSTISYQI